MINRATFSNPSSSPPPIAPGLAAARGAPQPGASQAAGGTSAQQTSALSVQVQQQGAPLRERKLRLDSQRLLQYKRYMQWLARLESGAALLRQDLRSEGGRRQVVADSRQDYAHFHGLLRSVERQARREGAFEEARMLRALGLQLKQHRQALSVRVRVQFSAVLADPRRRQSARSLYDSGQLDLLELTRMISDREDEDGEAAFDAQLSDLLVETNHLMATAPKPRQEEMKSLTRFLDLKQLYFQCKHVRHDMLAKNPGFEMKTAAFMKALQQLISNGMQPKETLQLVQNLGGSHLENQLALVNRLLALLKELKYKTWADIKSRQTALDNLLLLSTALVNEEQRRKQEALA